MTWPFNRRKAKVRIRAAEEAVETAREELRQVQGRSREVQAVSGSLRRIRERNHFADQLRVIMEGGKNHA